MALANWQCGALHLEKRLLSEFVHNHMNENLLGTVTIYILRS